MRAIDKGRKWFRRGLDELGGWMGHYLFDVAGPADRAIWVVGDGRSGTTWVANVLNADGRARILFEPCHPEHVVDAAPFGPLPYARPRDAMPDLYDFYCRVFSGRLHGKWVDRYNQRWLYHRRVVKDIRANLFLEWAVEQFPQIRKIVVVRHPFAVAVSKQIRRDWLWFDDPASLLANPFLLEDYLAPFQDTILRAKTFFERQVVLWCVSHLVPLRQLCSGGVHVVFYEHLVMHPGEELRRLLGVLNDPELGALPEAHLLDAMRVPSQTSHAEHPKRDPLSRVETWQDVLDKGQIQRGQAILRAFGLDSVYGLDALPCAGALTSAMALHAP